LDPSPEARSPEPEALPVLASPSLHARSLEPGASQAAPALDSGWLLRAAALVGVAACAMGIIVAPGVQGNAGEKIVVAADRVAATLAYAMYLLLVVLIAWGAMQLARKERVPVAWRIALIGAPAVALTVGFAAFFSGYRHEALSTLTHMALATSAIVSAFAAAIVAARTPHTRAVAAVLVALSFAAVARLCGWELATAAGERASTHLFAFGRGFATSGVVFEALAQLMAVAWLGTRNRITGQLASTTAIAAALLLTWGVARGVHSGAAFWEAVMHTALADAAGIPPPFGLEAIATFLVPSAMLLALVSAVKPKQPSVVVGAMGLALLSRGSFDAPLRGLAVVAAAQWIAIAMADDRVMWRSLLDERKEKYGPREDLEPAPSAARKK
jgi:hypothetical protein